MTQIEIPFNDRMAKMAKLGLKKKTTRSTVYGRVGDTFKLDSVWFKIVAVSREKLQTVAYDYYKDEGFESPEDFIEFWNHLHPKRKYRPDDLKWVHTFAMVYAPRNDYGQYE